MTGQCVYRALLRKQVPWAGYDDAAGGAEWRPSTVMLGIG